MMSLSVKKLSPTAQLPVRNLPNDAGLDLFANEDVFVPVGKTVKIKTGIAIDIKRGFVGLICDRSGLASKGLRTGAGVVDTGYHGEIMVVMHNLNNETSLNTASFSKIETGYCIKTGDKIAQLLIQQISLPLVEEIVGDFEKSERGECGFGSSGV